MNIILIPLLVLVIIQASISTTVAYEVHIVPNENYACPTTTPCLTLDQFASDVDCCNSSNISLVLTGNNHSLSKGICVSNIGSVSIVSTLNAETEKAEVVCSNDVANLIFSSVGSVYIRGLTFVGCHGSRAESVDQLTIEQCDFIGGGEGATALTIRGSEANLRYTKFLSNGFGEYRANIAFLPVVRGSSVGGALVITNSSVSITACQFEENSASVGGAIFSELASNVTIDNSDFIANQAVGCDIGLCYGGAIFVHTSSSVLVRNSRFRNNTSDGSGGVATIIDASLSISHSVCLNNKAIEYGGVLSAGIQSDIEVSDCYFSQNLARIGSVLSLLNESTVTIIDGIFEENRAMRRAGGIYASRQSTVHVLHSTFRYNLASTFGGVLSVEDQSTSNIVQCNFTNNGAIHGGVMYLSRSKIRMNDSRFHNNAAYDGGCVNARSLSIVEMNNSTFENNEAIHNGGVVIASFGGMLSIDSCTFNSNSAKSGGVFVLESRSTIHVSDSMFRFNNADIDGAVVASYRACTLYISNGTFYQNEAFHDGGVAYMFNESTSVFDSCNFSKNMAIYGGVLAALRGSSIDVDSCVFTGNSATTDGAFMYGYTNIIFNIESCVFNGNEAGNDGGVWASDNSTVRVGNARFLDNTAGHDGASIFVYYHTELTIDHSYFVSNEVLGSGGAIYGREYSMIEIQNSTVTNCTAQISGGGIHAQRHTYVYITACTFTNNMADYGGVMRIYQGSTSVIKDSNFWENRANLDGGVVAVYRSSTADIITSNFSRNVASFGGVFTVYRSVVNLNDSLFYYNTGEFAGVIRLLEGSRLWTTKSDFRYNSATFGGVLYCEGGNITIHSSYFERNHGNSYSGVIYADHAGTVVFNYTTFVTNSGGFYGGVMSLFSSTRATIDSCDFHSNTAGYNGGCVYVEHATAISLNSTFSSIYSNFHGGVFYVFQGSVIIDSSRFSNCQSGNNGGVISLETECLLSITNSNLTGNEARGFGGAISAIQRSRITLANNTFLLNRARLNGGAVATSASHVVVQGCNLDSNVASGYGGALAIEAYSTVDFYPNDDFACEVSESTLNNNSAISQSGGGIYLSLSNLTVNEKLIANNNEAYVDGGGILASNSHIVIRNALDIVNNTARHGGGLNLKNSEINSTLIADGNPGPILNFESNIADYGAALFVDDSTCASLTASRCFFASITDNGFKFNFTDNNALVNGENLYGGLLDRCVLDENTVLDQNTNALSHFISISNLRRPNFSTVSSDPVNLCFCEKGKPNCSVQRMVVNVTTGEPFSFSLAAVDQVRLPVTAILFSTLHELGLPENQTIQKLNDMCQDVKYQVIFPTTSTSSYELSLNVGGQCNNSNFSKLTAEIQLQECECAPGFMPEAGTFSCTCICDNEDDNFKRYVQVCDADTQSIIRQGLFWITYLQDNLESDNTSKYLISPYCPIDYCQPPSVLVPVRLYLRNGSDAQCDNNRGGVLCGSCLPSYSLSLGGSTCIECPDDWYGLFVGITIAAFFGGIFVVFLVLVLNLTVSIGSFNSIIFYANIINVNRSIYFRQNGLTFASVFISWLNLEMGFDTCYYEGMNMYAKTWIQLAFPVYLFILVVIVIWLSSCSSKFAKLLGQRNPVAALATVIVLSYAKLLQTMITSFSFVTLTYPNGTRHALWLPDATFEVDKHKIMFGALISAAIVILIIGLLYTIVLFSWQWLVSLSDVKFFKWTKNPRISTFVSTYHKPYTSEHRYWLGLLLFVRSLIYLIAGVSSRIEQPVTLAAIIVIMSCLSAYKSIRNIRVYRNKLLNTLESLLHLSLILFTFITHHTFGLSGYETTDTLLRVQFAVAVISVGLTMLVFLIILIIHAYRYGSQTVYDYFGHDQKIVEKMYSHSDSIDERSTIEASNDDFLDVIDSPRPNYVSHFVLFRKRPSKPDVTPLPEQSMYRKKSDVFELKSVS